MYMYVPMYEARYHLEHRDSQNDHGHEQDSWTTDNNNSNNNNNNKVQEEDDEDVNVLLHRRMAYQQNY